MIPGLNMRRFSTWAVVIPVLAAVLAVGAAAGSAGARAETPEEKGRAIFAEAERRNRGYESEEVDGEMVLRNQAGKESRRVFRSMVLERPSPDVGDKSVMVFVQPRDIRGVSLLTHDHAEPKNDDQWLYLPSIKRVKRISSSKRTGKFVASEFSYEDLGSSGIDDHHYKWLRNEPCPNDESWTCFVTESYPRNRKSGYSKRVVWIDTEEYRLHYMEFHNRRGDLEKTLTYGSYRQYLGKYWRVDRMTMVNAQTGKSTEMIWSDYRLRTGLTARDFSHRRLESLSR